ncbi:TolC family outer membrane protein [Achromobacter anxifer]
MKPARQGGWQQEDRPALDLVHAYERMLQRNPKVHAARAARDAGLDARNIARAALLPQASINYLRNRTQRTEYVVQRSGVPWIPARSYTDEDRFYGQRTGLTIEQVLFDHSAVSAYRVGETQAAYAEAQYRLQFQQQAIALIEGYLNAVLARDLLELARHQLRAYEIMLHDNERMLAQGEGTRIDVLETRAQLSTLRAQLVVHENELADRLEELSILVGEQVQAPQLRAINLNTRQFFLQGVDQSALLDSALQQSPEVQTARLAESYNDLVIEREKGRFMPRVSAYATHERIDSDSVNNRGRDYKSSTIGLQISIPIFSGGSSYYATRQAYKQREQASHELHDKRNSAAMLLRKYYSVCVTSVQRIRMLRENIADGASLVVALRRGVLGGERINSDVLNAEHQAYQARQELLRAFVDLFLAYSKVQFYAGIFSDEDLLLLNQQLVM